VTSRTEAFAIPSPDPAPLRANAGEAALPNPVPKSAEASARASMASGKRASAAGVSSESASGLGQGKRVAAAVMAESAAPRSGLRDRTPRAPSEASARVSAETAGLAFAQAFDAFSRGAYEVAEERFLRFEREYRTDTRVEDAAFLRAICRQRRGDRAGAARDADEYLRKFPSGFRRREAEAILVSH
jgi:TolA-binding protein